MIRPLPILLLRDGKPGHENQSLGLIEAIERLTPVAVERLHLEQGSLRELLRLRTPQPPPALVVGTGHRTHLPMLEISRRTDAFCVVLMKPSLPSALFDLCILPEHDLGPGSPPPQVITSNGALNRVPPPGTLEKRGGLILLGGPSKRHGWEENTVFEAVKTIVSSRGDRPWRATDSRRSLPGTLEGLSKVCPALATYPCEATGPEWVPQRLAEAAEVWVSEDSVSMIYESLSSGARVGLLPAPAPRQDRVTRAVSDLAARGWVTRFADWSPGSELPAPPAVLREADRCARLVLDRFFPDLLA